jgi:hypothetical protein
MRFCERFSNSTLVQKRDAVSTVQGAPAGKITDRPFVYLDGQMGKKPQAEN